MVPMHHGWLWFPEKPGLISGIIIGGFGFGALIFGNVARVIVNPDNIPESDDGKFPPEVDGNVQKMLLILSISFSVLAMISIALIQPGVDHTNLDRAAETVAAMSIDNTKGTSSQ